MGETGKEIIPIIKDKTDIYIYEMNISETYGLFLWPSSFILSKYLYDNALDILSEHTTIIELGSGTSLPSLLLIKLVEQIKLDQSNLHVDQKRKTTKRNGKEYQKTKKKNIILYFGQNNFIQEQE